jgi:putative flavoprotein involved in K+ transport
VELKGYEEHEGIRAAAWRESTAHGKHRTTWKEEREAKRRNSVTAQPYVLIIGGGQGGIALGARLRQLGVPTIIVEKNERPGDSWRKRYKSLCLHDPVWYDHLPYIKFPENWPVFSPKDKIGDWLEILHQGDGAELLDEDHLQIGELRRSREGMDRRRRPRRRGGGAEAETAGAGDRHVGKANVPAFPGMDKFKGDQHHSSKHPGPDAYRGKKAVVSAPTIPLTISVRRCGRTTSM